MDETGCSKGLRVECRCAGMARTKFALVAAAAVAALSIAATTARADNRSVTVTRTTQALLEEYSGEVQEGERIEDHGESGRWHLFMKQKVEGSVHTYEWVPVVVLATCSRATGHGASYRASCVSRLWTVEAGQPYQWILEDRATFRGRKGTYHESGWEE